MAANLPKASFGGFGMPASARRIYFDANVFLAYVGNEEGRADVVQALLDEGRCGQIEIVTSVLSIAEVAYGAHEIDSGLTEAGEDRSSVSTISWDDLWNCFRKSAG